jgi:hypothetical protein
LTLIEPALQNLVPDDPDVGAWLAAIGQVYSSGAPPAVLAEKFGKLAGIPSDLLRGGLSGTEQSAEMGRLGQGLKTIRLPSKDTIQHNLKTLANAGIRLLTVSGGWNPGIDSTAAAAARVGGGRHVIVKSEHHFPQLASDEFNQVLLEFMKES